MPVSPHFTLTGTIQGLTGAADQGYVSITLVNYNGIATISGTSLIANSQYKATCDASGVFSVTIWGNDQITPANTYYVVQLFSGSGPQSAPLAYSLTGTGTFDLSGLLPLNSVPAVSSPTTPEVQPYVPVAHQFLTGLDSSGFFSAAQPSFSDISGTATGSQLPTPTPTTLGGVKSKASTSHQFVTQIGTDGSVTTTQPAIADLSDTPVANLIVASPNGSSGSVSARALVGADLPNPSASALGGVKSKTATSHQFLTQIGTDGSVSAAQPSSADLSDGVTGTGNVVLNNTPSLTTPAIGSAGATFAGSSSGTTTLKASATASGTISLPAATDTLVGKATVDSLTNKTVTDTLFIKRLRATQGTSLTTGDITLTGNWGTSPSVASVVGTDQGMTITITSGTGSSGANPGFSFNWKDGTWTNAPVVVCSRGEGFAPASAPIIPNGITATSAVFAFIGTPGTSTSYIFNIIAMGR